jgi:adenine deaminase
VAAGRRADVIVLDDLEQVAVNEVFVGGQQVAARGRMLVDVIEGPSDPPLDTMKLAELSPDDFLLHLDAPDGTHRMRVIADAVMTRWDETAVDVRDGVVEIPPGHLVQVTVHRHGRIDPRPRAALLAGWGDWTGAVATTVAHDTHNLVVFGRDPDDMALAANTVIASGGGVAVTSGGALVASVALPIAGILSPLPAAEVAAAQREVQDAALAVGLTSDSTMLTQPLFQVMLSSLACLPGPHVTDVGLIDGTTGELVPSALIS